MITEIHPFHSPLGGTLLSCVAGPVFAPANNAVDEFRAASLRGLPPIEDRRLSLFGAPLEKPIKLAQMDCELVAEEIGDFIVGEVLKHGYTGGVIGLSGGVDSTVTAALAKRAFDRHNAKNPDRPLSLIGPIMPSHINDPKDQTDAVQVAQRLGIEYAIQDIGPHVEAFRRTNPRVFKSAYDAGNLMSQIRAGILLATHRSEKKAIIGTGNRDEDYGIGYYTLFGDGLVFMNPIGNLPKRLVRQMAEFLGFGESARREPTAGLEPGQTDFRDLGYSYDAVEIVTEGLRQGLSPVEICLHNKVRQTLGRDLVLYEVKFGAKKFHETDDAVADILKRHKAALEKARLLSPPVARITLNYT